MVARRVERRGIPHSEDSAQNGGVFGFGGNARRPGKRDKPPHSNPQAEACAAGAFAMVPRHREKTNGPPEQAAPTKAVLGGSSWKLRMLVITMRDRMERRAFLGGVSVEPLGMRSGGSFGDLRASMKLYRQVQR
jgi:hypothetical protein